MVNNQHICGECDTPVTLSDTLRRLNESQLKLLINTTQNKEFQKADNERLNDLNPSDYLTKEKLDLYNQLPRNAKPMYIKSYFESEDEEDDEDDNDEDQEEEEEDDDDDDNDDDDDGTHGAFRSTRSNSNTNSDTNSYLVVSENDDLEEANGVQEGNRATSNINNLDLEDEENYEIKISSRIKTLNKIFRILSNTQDIDHPLSENCANLLIENYKLKFDQSQKEKEQYLSFLKKLKLQDSKLNLHDEQGHVRTSFGDDESLDNNLKQTLEEYKLLTQKEQDGLQELKKLESTRTQLEQQISKSENELEDIKTSQLDKIMRLRNELQLNISDKQTKLDQLKASYQLHLNHIDELRNFNIYKLMFDINLDEKYGMINGLRIGYKIVWPEVNAALGQISLLVAFILRRLHLKLEAYKLVPMGSQSHIVKFTKHEDGSRSKKILNLYSSDEFTLGRLFNFNKMDVSLIALLEILSIISIKLRELDTDIELPYKIKNDSIGGKSIRVTSNSEWTQSCKLLLTNLNWMLIFVQAHTSGPDGSA
ncbi:Vacuolar protein sorting-associated protein atg6 [Lodderomyces elongisporus]|uniref:Vacuolar protein sorting-associated protein atg6 n=1 Tax=Lodderomyces elongisporus TaxID=36914 RepID=UPI0029259771|nr:Vacuolar protein sorting-associated protein atg6 [Lodderomyces elongisporus]WLF80124.1 Vacuolar protein sorting-associated protein atg6 [Lodderomyces elongisporus]